MTRYLDCLLILHHKICRERELQELQRKSQEFTNLIKDQKSKQRLWRLKSLRCAMAATKKGTSPEIAEKKAQFFACGSGTKNLEYLKPYLKEMIFNGQECRVLTDSAATMNVVHPKYVSSS